MADEWISTHETYTLMTRVLAPPEAARAICTWAREGIITGRAKRLVIAGEAKVDAEVPAEFWRNMVEEALSQEWTLGEFHTEIGHIDAPGGAKFCHAYGVEFKRSEIASMLPPIFTDGDRDAAARGSTKEPRVSDRWHQWVAELVGFFHDNGVPPGVGSQSQEMVIKAVAVRLAERGIKGPERSTVQPVVQAVLDRLRSAEN